MAEVNLMPEPEQPEECNGQRKTLHPELKAVGAILRILEDMTPLAQSRALTYLVSLLLRKSLLKALFYVLDDQEESAST